MIPLVPEVRRLIRERVENLDQLEILMLLYQSRDRAWTVGEISAALAVHTGRASAGLSALRRHGLVAESEGPSFRFSPESPELADDVKLLLNAYNTQPVTLVRAVYEARAINSFAEAFRLRKPQGEE